MIGIELAERGWLPDTAVRFGIRRILRERLREIDTGDCEAALATKLATIDAWSRGPIALVPDLANDQHYEVAPAFFEAMMGRRLKYSCGYWPGGVDDLDASEEAMLRLTCERAGVRDGMRVLDLGCGWGSLSLFIAEQFPEARVLSVSNSKPQREFIQRRCERDGLDNVEIVTADVNDFDVSDPRVSGSRALEGAEGFDRVVSVEMFEHVRNHRKLLARIASWLAPAGKLFVHHFSHREHTYPYEARGDSDWMATTFFSGGIMPSDDLLTFHPDHLRVEQRWRVNGQHYARTCNAWLARLDEKREQILPVLAEVYGRGNEALWLARWRIFCMACAELFDYRDGNEWFVSHVLLSREGRESRD